MFGTLSFIPRSVLDSFPFQHMKDHHFVSLEDDIMLLIQLALLSYIFQCLLLQWVPKLTYCGSVLIRLCELSLVLPHTLNP